MHTWPWEHWCCVLGVFIYLFIICWTPGPRVLFVKGISPASETSKDTSELFHVPPQLLRNGSRCRLSICFSASCWWLSPTFPWCSLLMSWPRLEHSFHFSTKISSESASERECAHVLCLLCIARWGHEVWGCWIVFFAPRLWWHHGKAFELPSCQFSHSALFH